MDKTIKLYRQHRVEAVIGTAFFAVFLGFSVPDFFVRDPAAQGYHDRHQLFINATMSTAGFGVAVLLGVYLLVNACRGLLTISGTLLTVRSALRTRRFDVSRTSRLRWGKRGKIVLRDSANSITIELYAASRSDRLQIIRFLRAAVPEEKQEGWPLFCLRTALAVRDRVSPPNGLTQDVRLKTDPARQFVWASLPWSLAALALIALLLPLGIPAQKAQWIALAIFVAWFLPFFYLESKAKKRQKQYEALTAPLAAEQWDAGELE